MPRAAGLAAAIQEKTGEAPELVKGDGGIFDVELDGRVIFSKQAEGRFPEHEEILALLDRG